jgi:hypothetical protein
MVLMESWHATVGSHGAEPKRQVLKHMAQPHTGPAVRGRSPFGPTPVTRAMTAIEPAVQSCWWLRQKVSIVARCRGSAVPIEKFPLS